MKIEVDGVKRRTRILLSKSVIKEKVQEIAKKINQDYPNEETLVVLIVLHGSLLFAADLVRHLDMPTEIESLQLKSYHGTQSRGAVELLSNLPKSLINKNVLIVEDIVDTGRTIQFLTTQLTQFDVKSISICTLLNKPSEHLMPVQLNYIGFNIGKNFVIGYGLDLNGKYRNLPYIAEIL